MIDLADLDAVTVIVAIVAAPFMLVIGGLIVMALEGGRS